MLVHWSDKGYGLHSASVSLGSEGELHTQVESLGESGWDWHVWDGAGQVRQRYGLADTLAEAKGKAEAGLEAMTQELGLAAQVSPHPS